LGCAEAFHTVVDQVLSQVNNFSPSDDNNVFVIKEPEYRIIQKSDLVTYNNLGDSIDPNHVYQKKFEDQDEEVHAFKIKEEPAVN
jgi:hypothetical protein